MNDIRKKLLVNYIKANVAPILVDFIEGNEIPEAIVLPANISSEYLNGHFEGVNFIPPKWFNQIVTTNEQSILVIDKIDTVSKEEQTKFIEILKYKKISTFIIPENTIIIVTAKKINKETINEEIYSLVAHIKG